MTRTIAPVQIALTTGEAVSVSAEVSGGLAVHPTVPDDLPRQWWEQSGRWTVTHIASGRSLVQGLWSAQVGRALIARCLATPGIDWTTPKPTLDRDNHAAAIDSLRAEIERLRAERSTP